jgi:hypothetical protein
MAIILALDQPSATFPSLTRFHRFHRFQFTEMSIPTTRSSAIFVGAATLTAVGSSTFVSPAASREAFPLSLSPGTLIIMAPVIAFRISTDSTPISVSGIFSLAVASTSAYDIFAPPFSVTVTADVRGVRGSAAVLGTCASIFYVATVAALGLGAPAALVDVALVAPIFVTSEATVFSGFFLSVLLLFLGSTTLHSSPLARLSGWSGEWLNGPPCFVVLGCEVVGPQKVSLRWSWLS